VNPAKYTSAKAANESSPTAEARTTTISSFVMTAGTRCQRPSKIQPLKTKEITMKQQVTISMDSRVVERLDSHARSKRQKRGEALEALLCERFGIILIKDKAALNIIKEKEEEIASLQNQLDAALAKIEATKQKIEPRSVGVVRQLPLSTDRSSVDGDRFTMERG
jgi:hypothetical protein